LILRSPLLRGYVASNACLDGLTAYWRRITGTAHPRPEAIRDQFSQACPKIK
jgi:hypothetical protein